MASAKKHWFDPFNPRVLATFFKSANCEACHSSFLSDINSHSSLCADCQAKKCCRCDDGCFVPSSTSGLSCKRCHSRAICFKCTAQYVHFSCQLCEKPFCCGCVEKEFFRCRNCRCCVCEDCASIKNADTFVCTNCGIAVCSFCLDSHGNNCV